MNGNDHFFMQQNMNLICRDESCSVYQMKMIPEMEPVHFMRSIPALA